MDPAEQAIYLGVALSGRYRVTRHIGSGNFSGVFQATDLQTGREVAVKILSFSSNHSPEARVEFDGEKALLYSLAGCEHVVSLIDHGSHPLTLTSPTGSPLVFPVDYLVLELADATVAELLLLRHRLPWADRLRLFRDVVKGVHQMHLRHVVHRDVKGDNALVHSNPQVAKVSDLGRSKDTSQPPRFASEAYVAGRGDLRFAPPEFVWLCGEGDAVAMACADLYLLGSLLFEFAAGVGITALALPNANAILSSMQRLPEAARHMEFATRRRELVDQYAPVHEIFAQELPPALRDSARALLVMLTDPDPRARMPGYRRPVMTPWNLEWILRRVDVLLKIDGYTDAAKARSKKGLRHR